MSKVKTVKVMCEGLPFIVINESDLTSDHTLYEEEATEVNNAISEDDQSEEVEQPKKRGRKKRT